MSLVGVFTVLTISVEVFERLFDCSEAFSPSVVIVAEFLTSSPITASFFTGTVYVIL